jgi:hypothetical protein
MDCEYLTDNHGRLNNAANRHSEHPVLSQRDESRTTEIKADQEEMKADIKRQIGVPVSRIDFNQEKNKRQSGRNESKGSVLSYPEWISSRPRLRSTKAAIRRSQEKIEAMKNSWREETKGRQEETETYSERGEST